MTIRREVIEITAVDKFSATLDTAQQQFGRLGGAIDKARGAMVALGAVAGAGIFGRFALDIVASAARLEGMAVTLGASVEELSRVQRAAQIAGTNFDGLSAALTRMVNGLRGANDEGQAASRAFAHLGIASRDAAGNIRDPIVLFREMAESLSRYRDSAEKFLLVRDALGRGAEQHMETIDELGRSQRMQATVTTQQALAAAKLADEWRRLRHSMVDLVRPGTLRVVSFLAEVTEAIASLVPHIATLHREFSRIPSALANLMPGAMAIRGLRDMLRADAAAREPHAAGAITRPQLDYTAAEAVRERVAALNRQIAADAQRRSVAAAQAAREREARERQLAEIDRSGLLAGIDALEQAWVDELRAIAAHSEAWQRDEIEQARQFARDWAEAIDQQIYTAEREALLSTTSLTQRLWELEEARLRTIEDAHRAQADAMRDSQRAMQQFGFTMASAFEDAIVRGRNLRDVLAGISQDIARMIVRRQITDPIAAAVGGWLGGGSVAGDATMPGALRTGQVTGGGGSIWGSISSTFAGWFANGGHIPPGGWGIAGERGPEIVTGGRTGATVTPAGGTVINVHISAVDAQSFASRYGRQVVALIEQAHNRAGRTSGMAM